MLLAGRIAVPLVLLGTETRVADGHVASVRSTEAVLRRRRVFLRQVVLHDARMWPVAAKKAVVALALELSFRGRAWTLDPTEHLLEGRKPDVLVGREAVEELVQGTHVSSGWSENEC